MHKFVQAKIQGYFQIFKEFLKQFKDFSRTKAGNSKFKEFLRTLPFFKDFSSSVQTMKCNMSNLELRKGKTKVGKQGIRPPYLFEITKLGL